MSVIRKLLNKSGLADLFTPPPDDEEERQRTLAWINYHLGSLVAVVLDDIEKEKQGLFVHLENPIRDAASVRSLGYIQYELKDKNGKRMKLPRFSLVSLNSIKMTENYQKLKSIVEDASYTIELKEINIDGDGVETYMELDEYTDDFERYFIITISGWL
jgi:hypothetical protein